MFFYLELCIWPDVISQCILQRNSDEATFLSWIITGDESWVYGYDSETKQQSSQWKSPYSPRPKKARQVKGKVKSMLIIFFDIKRIVHKEFVLAGQTVNFAYYHDIVQ
jgi:histone-lysine N-methyltransferase SETMAR